MNINTGEFNILKEVSEHDNKIVRSQKPSERDWIRFDKGEEVSVKGQKFLIDGVDLKNHRLILVSKILATGKEGMSEMMARVGAQTVPE